MKKLEWLEEMYLISHLNVNYTSGYLLQTFHRVEKINNYSTISRLLVNN